MTDNSIAKPDNSMAKPERVIPKITPSDFPREFTCIWCENKFTVEPIEHRLQGCKCRNTVVDWAAEYLRYLHTKPKELLTDDEILAKKKWFDEYCLKRPCDKK